MNGEFLLDTNIVIGLLAGEEAICQCLAQRTKVLLSTIVLGELYYGARKSRRINENLAKINKFAFGTVILGCDITTAYEYSTIKNELRLKGRPIPENDLWLAAVARQYDLILVSRDRHFAVVDKLLLEQW